jgi:hypothetical protein
VHVNVSVGEKVLSRERKSDRSSSRISPLLQVTGGTRLLEKSHNAAAATSRRSQVTSHTVFGGTRYCMDGHSVHSYDRSVRSEGRKCRSSWKRHDGLLLALRDSMRFSELIQENGQLIHRFKKEHCFVVSVTRHLDHSPQTLSRRGT